MTKDDRRTSSDQPYCFGKLENVFPMGENGLRCTPESCFPCRYKTECLRCALQSPEGSQIQAEQVDRAYDAGMITFLERWSKRKSIHRRKVLKTKKS